jgi:hypothetical protein
MIGLFDRLLRLIPHRHEPIRHFTPIGWVYKCAKWYCGEIAHTEIGLTGGSNAEEFLDMRRRSW